MGAAEEATVSGRMKVKEKATEEMMRKRKRRYNDVGLELHQSLQENAKVLVLCPRCR